jgi:hypothetical protein
VEVGVPALQIGPVKVLDCSDTWPVKAQALPLRVAPVLIVIEIPAIAVPTKCVVVSIVIELTAVHQILQGSPPTTDEPGAVIISDADMNIQTPDPLRVRTPVR